MNLSILSGDTKEHSIKYLKNKFKKGNVRFLENNIQIAEYFGLKSKDTKIIIDEIKDSIQKWTDVAKSFGISRSEIEEMRIAFKV